MNTSEKEFDTKIVNIRKSELNKRGIENFDKWNERDNTLYIGRNMSFYPALKNVKKSKWHNPYSVKKYGLEECLEKYREHVVSSGLINDIEELRGKELGCWCKPNKCHGDVLIELLNK